MCKVKTILRSAEWPQYPHIPSHRRHAPHACLSVRSRKTGKMCCKALRGGFNLTVMANGNHMRLQGQWFAVFTAREHISNKML